MWEILASHLHDLLQLEMIFLISVGTLIGLVVGVIPGMMGWVRENLFSCL